MLITQFKMMESRRPPRFAKYKDIYNEINPFFLPIMSSQIKHKWKFMRKSCSVCFPRYPRILTSVLKSLGSFSKIRTWKTFFLKVSFSAYRRQKSLTKKYESKPGFPLWCKLGRADYYLWASETSNIKWKLWTWAMWPVPHAPLTSLQ